MKLGWFGGAVFAFLVVMTMFFFLMMVLASASSCDKVDDHDRQCFCRALSWQDPKACSPIRDDELRQRCRETVAAK